MTSGARLRYGAMKSALCSVKLASDCGRPASTSATLTPASDRRLAAHPPEAPEPTTSTSKPSRALLCTRTPESVAPAAPASRGGAYAPPVARVNHRLRAFVPCRGTVLTCLKGLGGTTMGEKVELPVVGGVAK